VHESAAAAALVLSSCHSLVDMDGKLSGDPIEVAALETIGWTYDAEAETSKPTVADGKALTDADKEKTPAAASKYDVESVRILQRFRFASELQRMAVVAEVTLPDGVSKVSGLEGGAGESGHYAFVKGSPEAVRTLLAANGVPSWYDKSYTDMAERGLRVLALAYKKMPSNGAKKLSREEVESKLFFAGFIAFECLSRADSGLVVGALRESDHKVAMLTGDSPLTALHIARTCGITMATCQVFSCLSRLRRRLSSGSSPMVSNAGRKNKCRLLA